jgi:alanyl-tRNA synthetase
MKADALRSRYLKFFADRGHQRVPSSSLVPDDPTLLFTSAGMVQFKDVFWGRVEPKAPTAVSSQKCFRTTDIESVGRTAYHHTFFEMLGNFSFGDYFKEGAIRHAWAFLTEELSLPPERLRVSVYEEDEEAYALWTDLIGIPAEHVRRLGVKHNWWGPVGDRGPCGPDSELFYDMGEWFACGPDCEGVACACDRFSEIWNLVFMEFDAQPDGRLERLAKQCIDTGMGLERTAAALQGVTSDYDGDLFLPIVQTVEQLAGGPIAAADIAARNVIADHIRGVVALLADGVRPGNERQGYVLRRILRRAVRAGQHLGLAPGALSTVVEPVIATLGGAYPEIAAAETLAKRVIDQEETGFRRTLREGEARLMEALDGLRGADRAVVPGDLAFELYDTYGFPVELTEEIAGECGLTVDREGFDEEMDRQRARSRPAAESRAAAPEEAAVAGPPTRFVGYDTLEVEAPLLQVVQEGETRLGLVFETSPFYATAGGQVADTGVIENLTREGTATVIDARRIGPGIWIHSVDVARGAFREGDRCALRVDSRRRRRIERNHTATHLVHAALQQVLGEHATQAGSQVTPDELRFDFTHFEPMRAEEITAVEDLVNAVVLADEPVVTEEMPVDEAVARGAAAHFTEEYRGKSTVRVISVDAFSKELCGGTHVRRSGEIGALRILSEEGIAAGTRRIRAITGDAVVAHMRRDERLLSQLQERLGADPLAGLRRLEEELEALREAVRDARERSAAARAEALVADAERHGDAAMLIARSDDLQGDDVKAVADRLVEALAPAPAVVVLASAAGARVVVVCKRSPALDAIDAGSVVREISKRLGGGGGGSPQFAQGGGTDASELDAVLEALRDRLREQLMA